MRRAVAHLRNEFARWLRRTTGMDETRLCDTVLAVNEALANAAEFAYLDGGAGTLDVDAVLDPARRTVIVTVTDHGRWRGDQPAEQVAFPRAGYPADAGTRRLGEHRHLRAGYQRVPEVRGRWRGRPSTGDRGVIPTL